MYQRLNEILNQQVENVEIIRNSGYLEKVICVAKIQAYAIRTGGKILVAGNGGSAADAQHFAGEFVGRFQKERIGLPAISLTTDTSVLTCIGNDYGYDNVISRQVEALGKKGDVFVGISTSGNSKNIIKAVKKASEMEMITVGLLGKDGGMLKTLCKYELTVPLWETPRIQEFHTMTVHMLCELVEREIFNEEDHGKITQD